MKRKGRNIAHFVLLLVLTAGILVACNGAIFLYMMGQWKNVMPVSEAQLMNSIYENKGKYFITDEGRVVLEQADLFAMIIDNDGNIIWSERLPENLKHEYTLQDVARFTRYYLDDYPVRTYVTEKGLLVIGGARDSVWKYTLEYDMGQIRAMLFQQLPILFLMNALVLFLIPLFIQRNWALKKEAERTEWIAGVSHDIRTPLTLIIGNADSISRQPEDKENAERARLISKQGLKICSLIANLNTSSKLDYGMGCYEKKRLSVAASLREVVADIINRNSDEQYEFDFKIEEGLGDVTVKANEELFSRMIENLIGNSIRHNPEGCIIHIFLGKIEKKKKHVICISDDGVGAENKLFRKLNRKHHASAEKLGEHGIGLRVVKQIVSYHSWGIHFEQNGNSGFKTQIFL